MDERHVKKYFLCLSTYFNRQNHGVERTVDKQDDANMIGSTRNRVAVFRSQNPKVLAPFCNSNGKLGMGKDDY